MLMATRSGLQTAPSAFLLDQLKAPQKAPSARPKVQRSAPRTAELAASRELRLGSLSVQQKETAKVQARAPKLSAKRKALAMALECSVPQSDEQMKAFLKESLKA
jgi:hypothetical protein